LLLIYALIPNKLFSTSIKMTGVSNSFLATLILLQLTNRFQLPWHSCFLLLIYISNITYCMLTTIAVCWTSITFLHLR